MGNHEQVFLLSNSIEVLSSALSRFEQSWFQWMLTSMTTFELRPQIMSLKIYYIYIYIVTTKLRPPFFDTNQRLSTFSHSHTLWTLTSTSHSHLPFFFLLATKIIIVLIHYNMLYTVNIVYYYSFSFADTLRSFEFPRLKNAKINT